MTATQRQPTIVRRLAFGGMAELFLVAPTGCSAPGPFQVVKQILAHLRDDPACQRMFMVEGELGLRLNHPNIVRTLAVGRRADFTGAAGCHEGLGHPYIMMEFLDGLDLGRLLAHQRGRGERMAPQDAVAVGLGVAHALAHAHLGGTAACGGARAPSIVHRDVTPSNIMLTHDGQVKLIDFGVATNGDDAAASPGCIKGKLCYMSPEQVADAPVDGRSDQYSLALVIWECLAGEPCFPPGHHFATMLEVARGRVRRIEDFRPDLPESLCAMLHRALMPAASDRFADMAEFADVLAAASASLRHAPALGTRLIGEAASAASAPARLRAHITRRLGNPTAPPAAPLPLPRPRRGWAF